MNKLEKIAIITLAILFSVFLFVSCKDDPAVLVTGVKLDKDSMTLAIGNEKTLVATVTPEDATNKKVTWKSSDSTIATVDENGKVTGIAAGEAIITVTTEDGKKTATCTVTVSPIHVTGVTLDETSITLLEGETQTLVATVSPEDAGNKNVTWESSDESIATVDDTGKVTAVARGNATITVTTEDGGLTATCDVKVINELDLPLTLYFTGNGNLTINNPSSTLKYAKNGGSRTPYSEAITVSNGDIIELYSNGTGSSFFDFMNISCTADCFVYGNVISLIDSEDYANTTTVPECAFRGLFDGNERIKNHETLEIMLPVTELTAGCYYQMFAGCTSLTTAPTLPATTLAETCYAEMFYGCTSLTTAPALPATTLAVGCYAEMFYGCTSLTEAPEELPSTTLANSCYSEMFSGCTNLTTAPKLPATELKRNCYDNMFSGCTSLTTAPVLPATTLVYQCYYMMFSGCTHLNSITCLATDISADYCTYYWVDDVATTGTFTKAASMTDWTIDDNGIPYGWEVQNIDDSPTLPLTLKFTEAGELSFFNPASTLQYAKNGGDKTNYSGSISVINGDKIELYSNGTESTGSSQMVINCTDDCYVYGNVMSLIDPENYATITEVPAHAFRNLFAYNTNIKNHASASLVLPATTLAEGCYYAMFVGCTGITKSPSLPATTLAENCYCEMFALCTNLTTAPLLPAKTLVDGCYYVMFHSCSNLTSITCLAEYIPPSGMCTNDWVDHVSDTGTFIKSPSMNDWSHGDHGIPNGWTVQDYVPPTI